MTPNVLDPASLCITAEMNLAAALCPNLALDLTTSVACRMRHPSKDQRGDCNSKAAAVMLRSSRLRGLNQSFPTSMHALQAWGHNQNLPLSKVHYYSSRPMMEPERAPCLLTKNETTVPQLRCQLLSPEGPALPGADSTCGLFLMGTRLLLVSACPVFVLIYCALAPFSETRSCWSSPRYESDSR